MATLAWGQKVSPAFRTRVRSISAEFGFEPNDLMGCMAWESGRTFSPSVRNAAGSGAVGLIQFMPQTAAALGTSVEGLARMAPEQQLEFVRAYFKPNKGRLRNLGDLYMAILWPAGIGQPDAYVLFDRADAAHPARYLQNKGLDLDRNGRITRGEACAKVEAMRDEGLRPENAWTSGDVAAPAAPRNLADAQNDLHGLI